MHYFPANNDDDDGDDGNNNATLKLATKYISDQLAKNVRLENRKMPEPSLRRY